MRKIKRNAILRSLRITLAEALGAGIPNKSGMPDLPACVQVTAYCFESQSIEAEYTYY